MPNLRQTPRRPEYSRHLPTDSLLEASEVDLASNNLDALRSNAQQLAPMPAASSELHRMWIPCSGVFKQKHLTDVLDELSKELQPQIWKDARQARLLQEFKLIPNSGVRFTCASYDMASKLILVQLNAFGTHIQIARYSKYESRYYVDFVTGLECTVTSLHVRLRKTQTQILGIK
ncbi:unnamed protein product [Peronospora farinosa]|uniref:Uncharacterized protein n=1 Tax=Peronospora farinosa TaxID=134698 RepID=A0ABN8BVZ7_9STRA|nr:unnamed protein product [Peronospora farinosa]